MSKIRIETSDWLYNAGIVGLCNILENAEVDVLKRNNYIEFDEEELEDFGDKYFGYLVDKYEKFTTWSQIVSEKSYFETMDRKRILEAVDEANGKTDAFLKKINGKVEYMKNKVKSNSYKSAYGLSGDDSLNLELESKNCKKIILKKNQKIEDVFDDIEKTAKIYVIIAEYLEKNNVKRYINAKNVMYDAIQPFWSGVNFLHPLASNSDMYNIATEEFGTNTQKYLNSVNEKAKYNCIQCDRKLNKLSKPDSYDITCLKGIGVDTGRKSSHFWNHMSDSYICPVCNLVYGCVPAGFNMISGQGFFVNENSEVSNLVFINKIALNRDKSIDQMEQENYYNIVNIMKSKEVGNTPKQIGNIQVIKYDSKNSLRPYTFNILAKDKLILIEKNHKELSKLLNIKVKTSEGSYINVYYEVLQNVYNNRSQFQLLSKLFRELLNQNTKRTGVIKSILTINDNFMKGKGKMVGYKQIEECQKHGEKLRKAYSNKKAENKISGISYKLVNALKTKNTAKFTDTLLHAYMYLGEGVPTVFVEVLK
ncbi:MAG: type I-B CRISPR-associated protein Cas8b1/Cst1, partial [Proteocatella sp.]